MKFRSRAFFFALGSCWALRVLAAGAVAYAPGGHYAATRWDTFEMGFTVPPIPGNPLDLDFSVIFTGPGGEIMKIPTFYDGLHRYAMRFCPPTAGTWTFVTTSSASALNQLAGTVRVDAAAAGRHGPVIVNPANPSQLAYADGSICYPIAFEADWTFALDAENPASIPQTKTFIRQLAESGFNHLILNVFAYDVQWKRATNLAPQYDYGKPCVYPFGGSNAAPDHDTINVGYFQRFDRVIEELDHRGLAAHLMIYVWNKGVSWPAPRSAADNRYFDYVVKRYQGYPNIIWDVSKEATGYGHNDKTYITDRIDRLRALDAGHRLVTVHDYGYCSRFPDKVDFISIQNWALELWHVMMDVRAAHPDKPILNIEHGGYEQGPYHVFTGAYLDPAVCLERAYLSVFAGAFPTYYWQDAAWNVIIPEPTALPPAERPHYEYYRYLASWAMRTDLTTLVPAPRGYSNTGICLTNNRDRFVYLIPGSVSAISIHLPATAGKTVRPTWFDPFTGAYKAEPVHARYPDDTYVPPHPGRLGILIVETQSN